MNDVQKALVRLAQDKKVEVDTRPKVVTYMGQDGKMHTVNEGERVPVLPVRDCLIV